MCDQTCWFLGVILPNEVSLYMVGIESEELRQNSIDFWCRKIEGLTFKCLREEALSEPIVDYIKVCLANHTILLRCL